MITSFIIKIMMNHLNIKLKQPVCNIKMPLFSSIVLNIKKSPGSNTRCIPFKTGPSTCIDMVVNTHLSTVAVK